MDFVSSASTEITPHDEALVPALAEALPRGATVYVAHTPKSTLYDVARVAADLQARGLSASPHIVARRLESEEVLRGALSTLRASGVEQILLIAGDRDTPAGPYASTLDVIDSGVLSDAGSGACRFRGTPRRPSCRRAGRALGGTTPQAGNSRIARGVAVHIATQFGFDADAIFNWVQQLEAAGIRLPVHVGLAGPTSMAKLLRFAFQCGVRTSLHTAVKNPGSIGNLVGMKTTPGEMAPALVRLGAGDESSQIVRPHMFYLWRRVGERQMDSRG